MLQNYPDELKCDLAETYHIYDFRQFSLSDIACYACGLRDDSRVKLAMSERPVSFDTLLSAFLVDIGNTWLWMNSKNTKRPKSITEKLLGIKREAKQDDIETFASAEEFELAKMKAIYESEVSHG